MLVVSRPYYLYLRELETNYPSTEAKAEGKLADPDN